MKHISEVDKNFKLSEGSEGLNLRFCNPLETPATLYGVYFDEAEKSYLRLPTSVAKACDGEKSADEDSLQYLAGNGAGGRLRFSTNSRYIAVRGLEKVGYMNHMALTGSGGFALYKDDGEGESYFANLMFSSSENDRFEAHIDTGNCDWKAFTLYFPLYSTVLYLELGVDQTAEIAAGKPYKREGRIVYYGSSITQGACASRAGNSYQGRIARRIDMDYLNLGFSGNAKGELPMAEYLASLPAEIFVCDYDYNADSVAHLQATHGRLVDVYRKSRPTTPIILMSKPTNEQSAETCAYRDVVKATYERWRGRGDENIYFIDGYDLYAGEGREDCTVDGCHPNDLGFYRTSVAVGKVVEEILAKKENRK